MPMDPASAIGVASGVLSFVEATYKFLSILYTVYEIDQIGGYDELAAATDLMRDLSQEVLNDPTSTTPGPSGGISSVANVAQQCHSLAVDLGQRLVKTKAKSRKPGDIIKAAVRTVCSRSDIERLQRALDSCRAQLHLQLTLDNNHDAKISLARIELANAALLNATETTLAKRNQLNIMSSLRPETMNDRYHVVSEAAYKTFDWIFDDPKKEMASNLALVRPLKDWLDQGTGIFHISAKPGAGKSTLMKYLWSNPQTQEKLRSWAGSRPLTMARFFFWKPGSPQQKNQDGLMRSLLHQMLTQHPDAIAELFSKHWDPTSYDPWCEPIPIHLETRDVVVTLDRLLSEPEICNHAKFCFFLDGLDEHQDERRTSQHLVTSLLKWVDLAGGRLKLCVSSRELPVFQQGLPVNQKIRLHELTYDDITAVTHQTLEEHPEFQRRQGQQPEECSQLMGQIVDKSDGVFLWVALTLKLVQQSLEDGETTTAIRAQVDLLPEELEDFFHAIITSVPKPQRRKAYCSLKYVMTILRQPSLSWKHGPGKYRMDSMLRLSYLDEYLDGATPNDLRPDFTPLDEQAALNRIATATAQIQSRSRGLLEPSRPRVAHNTTVRYTHRSIHEFLGSFLHSDFAKPYLDGFDCVMAQIYNFIAQQKYSTFNVGYYDASSRDTNFLGRLYDELRWILLEVQISPSPKHYFCSLEKLEDTLCNIYAKEFAFFDDSRWEVYRSTQDLPNPWISCRPQTPWIDASYLRGEKDRETKMYVRLATPLYVAASNSFHEYIYWKLETCPDAWGGSDGAELLFVLLMEAIVNPDPHYGPFGWEEWKPAAELLVLREVLKFGGNPNFTFRRLDAGGIVGAPEVSPWLSFLFVVFVSGLCSSPAEPEGKVQYAIWSTIETMLEFGSVPPYWSTEMVDKSRLLVILTAGDSEHSTLCYSKISPGWIPKDRSPVFLDQGRWDLFAGWDVLTLRDMVHHDKPHNESRILKLLDDWDATHCLNEKPDGVHEEHAQEDGCDTEATPADSQDGKACTAEQSTHSESEASNDKGSNPSSPSEEVPGPAPTLLRNCLDVITHPFLPWFLVGKFYPSTLDSSKY